MNVRLSGLILSEAEARKLASAALAQTRTDLVHWQRVSDQLERMNLDTEKDA